MEWLSCMVNAIYSNNSLMQLNGDQCHEWTLIELDVLALFEYLLTKEIISPREMQLSIFELQLKVSEDIRGEKSTDHYRRKLAFLTVLGISGTFQRVSCFLFENLIINRFFSLTIFSK
jgi:hypothetical protein